MNYVRTDLDFIELGPIGNNEGLNSEVVLAKDTQLDANFVIKKIDKSQFNNIEDYFSEARALYSSKHPNVMEIQYASQKDNLIYLAMPYHEKGSLNSLINKRFLTVREIVKYSLDLLSAVAFVHSKGFLHLDIKPTNILLDKSGSAILTDFGLAKQMNSDGIAFQRKNYKVHLDPEYFKNSGRTPLSDIYQIGLTLYRLCNGNNIFYNQLQQLNIKTDSDLADSILKGQFPDRKLFLPHIPKKLRVIIKKCLEINPMKRYNNLIQIMNDLSDIDENLDWVFTGNFEDYYYIHKNNYKISLQINCQDEVTNILCTKTNCLTNRKIVMHNYSSNGHTIESSIIAEIERIISENN